MGSNNILTTLRPWPLVLLVPPDFVPERAGPMLIAVRLFTDEEHGLIMTSEAKYALNEASETRS